MSTPSGTLPFIASQLVLALQPLKEAVADLPAFRTFLYRLGWQAKSLPPEYPGLAAKVDALLTALDGLGSNPQPAQILTLLGDVRAVYQSIKGISTAPEGVQASEFLPEIGLRLTDLLLIDYLTAAFPGFYSLLLSLGIITQENVNETPSRPGFLLSSFHWDEIPHILDEPGSIPERVYGWGTDDFDFHRISGDLLGMFLALEWPAHIGQMDANLSKGFMDEPNDLFPGGEWELRLPVLLDNIGGKEIELGLALLELPPQDGKHAGVILQPLVPPEIGASYNISDSLRLELRAGSDVGKIFGVVLRPEGISVRFPFDTGAALPEAGFGATLRYSPTSPALLLGDPSSTRLTLHDLAASLELDTHEDGLELRAGLALNGLNLVLSSQDQDGFLRSVLGSQDATVLIPLAIQWSSRSGVSFAGGTGFRLSQATYLSLGPVVVRQLQLSLRTTADATSPPNLLVEAGASVSGNIGPISFAVDNVGLHLAITFQDGNTGPFNIVVGFMPPDGMGLSVDAAGVTGGGFLEFHQPDNEYSGVLQLEFNDLALQAFGLVTTRVAGAAGYSLLALIDADFPPVQLGWGFTLDGVGGLLSVNRSASTDALQAALKTNTLSSILFPKDAITNAPLILAELDKLFPTAPGRFLFGPMALIGWGTPTILTAAIAVIVELPEPIRIILLARIAARMPSESNAVVRINMDALGVLDLGKSELTLAATLFDSRILNFTISGDMALLATWGAQREFLLAIGGFNLQFQPPAGFPSLKRLTIDMPSGSISKLRLAAYLAITSNTVQFGAALDVFIGVSGYGLAGHLGFDALFQWSPFHFTANISGRVALTAGGDDLMSVSLKASLTGPGRWNVAGHFSIDLFFFDLSIDFSYSWGHDPDSQSLAPVDVMALLSTALQDARNWGTQLPTGMPRLVSLSATDSTTSLAHPLARLEVHESVVPLGIQIARIGAALPTGATTFAITDFAVNKSPVSSESVEDDFAPAQFFDLTDEEKLSRPSFETHDAGVRMGAGLVTSGASVNKNIAYETFYIDSPGGPLRTDAPAPTPILVFEISSVAAIGSAGRAQLWNSGDRRYSTPGNPIRIMPQAFVVADVNTLALAGVGPAKGDTYTEVIAALETELSRDRTRRDSLQIVSTHELIGS